MRSLFRYAENDEIDDGFDVLEGRLARPRDVAAGERPVEKPALDMEDGGVAGYL